MAYKKAVGTDYIPQNNTTPKKKKKVKASRKPGWILRITPSMGVIVLIFIIGMSFVAQHVWINFLGFQISELKNEIVDMETNNEKLKLKIANISSLDKVENMAVNQLGMIYPDDKSVHYIFSVEAQEGNEDTATRQLAGLATSPLETVDKERNLMKNIPRQAWLGTVEDFFYYWLVGDSRS